MTANVRVTRRATFAAAHVLCRSEWSDERNREAFGEDVNEHGHSYVVEVTVGGTVDPDTGMVVNLSHVDDVLRFEIGSAVPRSVGLQRFAPELFCVAASWSAATFSGADDVLGPCVFEPPGASSGPDVGGSWLGRNLAGLLPSGVGG